jgi:carbamate kinase
VTRVVVALGGNALLRKGAEDTIEEMRASARFAAEMVADIAALGWEIVVTHGNGPQVGRILLQQEEARGVVHPMPLDVCGAESQGQIGYLLQVAIGDVFFERGTERPVATVLTLTRVPAADPAFAAPTKPVGPYYDEHQSSVMESDHGWTMAADAHGGFRRVVPSPVPYSIVEASVITQLVADGVIVIAAGGGGVPVLDAGPRLVGVEAVVDKDLAGAILARDVGAKVFLDLTDVHGVYRDFDTDSQELIESLSVDQARELLSSGALGSGSMAPKVQAAVNFIGSGGERAAIASLSDGPDAIEGRAGTQITA